MHGDKEQKLKNEGLKFQHMFLKCRHMKLVTQTTLKVLTHEARYRHITVNFLNAKMSELALNEPQLPPTEKLTSGYYIQTSQCIYEEQKRFIPSIDYQELTIPYISKKFSLSSRVGI